MSSRKMPIGIQDFEKLRTAGYVYVDKTSYLYEIAKEYRPYFLCRPRRFGKSLLLSAMKAYFLGKKELFDGLAIAELEKDWIEYPVIYIDFNIGSNDCLQSVKIALGAILDDYESEWGISEKSINRPFTRLMHLFRSEEATKYNDLPIRFAKLIKNASKKWNRKVVVLVDEYDKALVNTMDNPKIHDELLHFFKSFYGVLKGMDYALRFVFLTGVTKFAKISIFSDLNQLIDISLYDQYAEICGISEAELLTQFQPELHSLAKTTGKTYDETVAEVKKRYDGYRFSEQSASIYNPFSILNTFLQNKYAYYWFKTGTTTFLANTLRKDNFDVRTFDNDIKIAVVAIDEYRANETSLVPLLYQSGYLSIKSYNPEYDEFTLGFPNEEVKYGFLKELLPAFAPQVIMDDSFSASRFIKALCKGDVEQFMRILTAFFASIPYDAIKREHRDEQYYQHLFYLLFTLMGQFVETEVKSAQGRADAVVKTVDSIFVFEFKLEENATAEDALKQIEDNNYLIPYMSDHRRLVKIGIEFSKESKGIQRWLTSD